MLVKYLAIVLAGRALAAPRCRGHTVDNTTPSYSQSTIGSTPDPTATAIAVTSLTSGSSASAGSTGASTTTATENSVLASKLSLDSTFIYSLDSTPDSPTVSTKTGVSVNANVYLVDWAETTKEEIAQYHSDGKTVICYFSAGTWDPANDDALDFDGSCVCNGGALSSTECSSADNKMAGWDEWWLDIHTSGCIENVQGVMTTRIETAASKGCDGIDPDNVDSYVNTDEQTHGNTETDQYNYLEFLSSTAKQHGLLIGLKNAGALLETTHAEQIIGNFDFAVIESCHFYDECDIYGGFLAAGKPQFQVEYGQLDSCPSLAHGQHLLVYSQDTLDTSLITRVC